MVHLTFDLMEDVEITVREIDGYPTPRWSIRLLMPRELQVGFDESFYICDKDGGDYVIFNEEGEDISRFTIL